MKWIKSITLVTLLTVNFSIKAQACSFETCPVNKETFEASIKRLKTLYPSLRFQSKWSDNRILASATVALKRINLSGGFARKKGINLGGFITVACHEVGHALLGLSEGEADYFSTSDCMKKYFELEEGPRVVESYQADYSKIQESCRYTFTTAQEIAQCIRIGLSSKNAANLGRKRCLSRVQELRQNVTDSRRSSQRVKNFYLRCLRTSPDMDQERFERKELLDLIFDVESTLQSELSFLASDERIVKSTYRSHNSPACRMQTLRNGNLLYAKPACWFKN
jgi:hypothetical protein